MRITKETVARDLMAGVLAGEIDIRVGLDWWAWHCRCPVCTERIARIPAHVADALSLCPCEECTSRASPSVLS